jgi:hypothetical protein
MKRSTILVALAFLLAALPAVAADNVIGRGIDPWVTVPEGTFADLNDNPIPAGFFCAQSQPFNGRIWLRGVPLASENKALRNTDTIVERLDNAVFNKRGVAHTRVQVRALQLIGIETFKTACGEYFVHVTLDGEQPTSVMRIFRNNAKGGRFQVDLRVNTKLVFTRVDNSAERLELADPVTLPTTPYARWTYRPANAKRLGRVMVDTDWDGTPDTFLPGTSNFSAGGTRFENKTTTHGPTGHYVYPSDTEQPAT